MDLKYDIKNNIGSAKKVLGETNYYVGVSKICARCGRAIVGYPALSRKDNRTEICSNCGTLEALEELMKYKKENKNETINQN